MTPAPPAGDGGAPTAAAPDPFAGIAEPGAAPDRFSVTVEGRGVVLFRREPNEMVAEWVPTGGAAVRLHGYELGAPGPRFQVRGCRQWDATGDGAPDLVCRIALRNRWSPAREGEPAEAREELITVFDLVARRASEVAVRLHSLQAPRADEGEAGSETLTCPEPPPMPWAGPWELVCRRESVQVGSVAEVEQTSVVARLSYATGPEPLSLTDVPCEAPAPERAARPAPLPGPSPADAGTEELLVGSHRISFAFRGTLTVRVDDRPIPLIHTPPPDRESWEPFRVRFDREVSVWSFTRGDATGDGVEDGVAVVGKGGGWERENASQSLTHATLIVIDVAAMRAMGALFQIAGSDDSSLPHETGATNRQDSYSLSCEPAPPLPWPGTFRLRCWRSVEHGEQDCGLDTSSLRTEGRSLSWDVHRPRAPFTWEPTTFCDETRESR